MITTRYGIVGLLRPITVYPSEMVYWFNLPTVSTFQGILSPLCTNYFRIECFLPIALHFNTDDNIKRLKLFWTAFTAMFVYEIIPAYIFPLLNGFNIVCLTTQKASKRTVDVITNLFGGTNGNEGLGFLSLSFDWQYIGSLYMSLPLTQQGKHSLHMTTLRIIWMLIRSKYLDWLYPFVYDFYGSLLLKCLECGSFTPSVFGCPDAFLISRERCPCCLHQYFPVTAQSTTN